MKFLTNADYHSILNYYKIPVDGNISNEDIKNKAEQILVNKLCKCIKKIDKSKKSESRAISICRKAVIQKKGYEINRFTCKNKPTLLSKKDTKRQNNTKKRGSHLKRA